MSTNMHDVSLISPSDNSRIDAADTRNRMAESLVSEEYLFEAIQSYPFHTDLEFRNGLSIILGHPGTPATDAEIDREDDLVLQAKCFYFSRKEKLTPPLNFSAYKAWLESKRARGSPSSGEATGEKSQKPDAPGPRTRSPPPDPNIPIGHAPKQVEEPAYPSSFAHIVELITAGQAIPGIQQIPNTVLAGHDTSSAKPRRRKPWEKGDDDMPAKERGEMEGIDPI